MNEAAGVRVQAKQARSVARFESIVRAAGELFDELGPDLTTTDAIARRAGVSIGTLYHFFENKTAIETTIAERFDTAHATRTRLFFGPESATLTAEEICTRSLEALRESVNGVPGARGLLVSTLGRAPLEPNPRLDEWLAAIEKFVSRVAPRLGRARWRSAAETYVTMTSALVVSARHSQTSLDTRIDETRCVLIGYTRQLMLESQLQ
jgi:AcrR family transcriptional regulator